MRSDDEINGRGSRHLRGGGWIRSPTPKPKSSSIKSCRHSTPLRAGHSTLSRAALDPASTMSSYAEPVNPSTDVPPTTFRWVGTEAIRAHPRPNAGRTEVTERPIFVLPVSKYFASVYNPWDVSRPLNARPPTIDLVRATAHAPGNSETAYLRSSGKIAAPRQGRSQCHRRHQELVDACRSHKRSRAPLPSGPRMLQPLPRKSTDLSD